MRLLHRLAPASKSVAETIRRLQHRGGEVSADAEAGSVRVRSARCFVPCGAKVVAEAGQLLEGKVSAQLRKKAGFLFNDMRLRFTDYLDKQRGAIGAVRLVPIDPSTALNTASRRYALRRVAKGNRARPGTGTSGYMLMAVWPPSTGMIAPLTNDAPGSVNATIM